MDIENIKCFISLAECLNFTKAAEREHTTQTSMSRKINSLESELHVTLFHRDRRSVKLTSAGTEFYTQAKKLIELYDQSVQTVQNIHCGLIRELKIGLGLYEDALIQSYIDSYMAQNPSVRVSCLQFRYHQLLEQFQENMLDIILTSDQFLNELPPGQAEQYLIHDAPWMIALSCRNPLCEQERISRQQMSDQNLVTMYEGSISQLFDYYCRNLPVRGFVHVNTLNTKIMLVWANVGIALLPSFVPLQQYPGVCFRPLEEDYTPRKFYILCKKDNPSQAVHDFVRNCAKSLYPHGNS